MSDKQFFECACHSEEHTVSIVYDEEDNELYLAVFLNQYRNMLQRIIIAIRYIFGYKCKYGHWDTVILQSKDVPRLQSLLSKVNTSQLPRPEGRSF